MSREQGELLAAKYDLDGIMIGRGVFQNPFVFAEEQQERSLNEMLTMLLGHVNLYDATWGATKSYNPLKRFFKIYVNGFPGASDLRVQLMETKSPDEAREVMRRAASVSLMA